MIFIYWGPGYFKHASFERVIDYFTHWESKGVRSLEAQPSTSFHFPQTSKLSPLKSFKMKTKLYVPFLARPINCSEWDLIPCTGFFCKWCTSAISVGQLNAERYLLLILIHQLYFLDIDWICTVDKTEKCKPRVWRNEPEMKVYLIIIHMIGHI